MKIPKQIINYSLLFLIIPLLLNLFGITNISFNEIISYIFLFIGIGLVYFYFGEKKRVELFISATIFFLGILIFLFNHFTVLNNFGLIITSIFFIISFDMLLLFLQEVEMKLFLYLTIAFFVAGLILYIILGRLNFIIFFNAILTTIEKYWLIILLVLAGFGIFTYELRESDKNKKDDVPKN